MRLVTSFIFLFLFSKVCSQASNERWLIEQRKETIELYQNAYFTTRQVSCARTFDELGIFAAAFYPLGRADELYVFNYGELEYYQVETGTISLIWSARLAQEGEEGVIMPVKNTFANWLKRTYPTSSYVQCGFLPSYAGSLEIFSSYAQRAYQGMLNLDGYVTCQKELANTFDTGESLQSYWYGVVSCDESEK
jgi:hypothetical protein